MNRKSGPIATGWGLAVSTTFIIAFTSMSAVSAPSANAKIYNVDIPVSIDNLPPGLLRSGLENLPAPAKAKALKWLQGMEFPAADVAQLRVDSTGGIFYEDLGIENGDAVFEISESIPVNSELTATNVFQLHSKPGASRVVYLDMDGHTLTGTKWNTDSGNTVLNMRPYDSTGDYAALSYWEIQEMAEIWTRVAEDFAAFDIDVTTEEPAGLGTSDYVGHILVSHHIDANGNAIYPDGSGGVAYVGVWGTTYISHDYLPALVFPDNLSYHPGYIGEAASHELGHNLGLFHDGTSTSSYYGGHGSDNTSWAPIMGTGYTKYVTQWSRGEYLDANNSNQDDLADIAARLTYSADDHENTNFSGATALIKSSSTTISSTNLFTDPDNLEPQNKGIIHSSTDIDLFYVDVGPGQIDLTVTPAWIEVYDDSAYKRGTNIDVKAILYNDAGEIVAQDDPTNDTFARVNSSVPAGRYILSIEGVGVRTVTDGYSDYASFGKYFINGTVPDDIVYTSAPNAPTDVVATKTEEKAIQLDWSDLASTAETNEAGYRIYRGIDGSTPVLVANLARDTTTFTNTNLDNGDYIYYLEVFNTLGSNISNVTDSINISAPIVSHVNAETTIKGLISSGSYLDTANVTSSETLSETHQGGRPNRRVSELEHVWTVNSIQAGSVVTLAIDAQVPSNTEGDNFTFSYSINGGAYTPIATIENNNVRQTVEAVLPSSSYGLPMNIKVVDTDKTVGNGIEDTVILHNISITSTLGDISEQVPVISITAPSETIVDEGTAITFTATANDYEDGDISSDITWIDVTTTTPLGTGSSITIDTLLIGSHTIEASVGDAAGNTVTTTTTVTITDPTVLAPVAPLLTETSSGLIATLSWIHDECLACSYTVVSSLKAKGQTATVLYDVGAVQTVNITENTSGTYTYIVYSDEVGAIDSNSVSIRLR